jgi:hypothetical protein
MSGTYYDFEGNPIDVLEWARLFESADRVLARTRVGDGSEVSTVWLGLDYSFGQGTPLIYETMIFGGPHDEYQDRHPNRDAALAGHDQAVALARDAARADAAR